ncbi:ABC transporter permease subunit [Betaproteobacteria bacterium LSUCC0117]|jgi:putrescine transport system permease protein|nr:ABC transporter permease subunit [Betaproteobacteria bacterium LSUCC0117]MDP4863798.1 ABC transporter permease subunit [Burkholderiaceae bacterium]
MNSVGQALAKRTGALWMTAVYAFLYLPLGFLIFFSFNSTRQDARFTGFSLRWYEALLRDGRLVDGFWLSLKVAVTTGTLSCILGTFAAFVLVRYHRFKGRTIFSGMINAPLVMPEVIIGLSLLLLMVAIQRSTESWFGVGWPDRGLLTIVFGHTLMGMAYAMVVIQSRLREMDRAIEEAAMDLGCRPAQVFFLVTLPNIAPALIAAWLLTFTLSFDDVVISEFLSGPGVTTLPQAIFTYARRGINPTVYAAATLLITTVTIAIVAYSLWVARATRRREKDLQLAARQDLQ